MDDSDFSAHVLQLSRFWVQKVFIPILVCVGAAGNILTVIVLTRKRMRCTTNLYLTALAMADLIYLLFALLLSFNHYPSAHDRKYELYWRFYGITHWLCDAASSTSVWLTVSFTIERYVAVCYPMKGKVFCADGRAKTIIVIIGLFCIITTAPTTFEYQLKLDKNCTRYCTVDELKKMHHGNTLIAESIHYVPSHERIILTNKNISESNKKASNFQDTLPLMSNSSAHPSVIYVPYYPVNVSKKIKYDDHLIAALPVNDRTEAFVRKKYSKENSNSNDQKLDNKNTVNETEPTMIDLDSDAIFDLNGTCCEKTYSLGTEDTQLAKNQSYRAAIHWFSSIFYGLLPLTLIATFNCFLIRTVCRSQKMRRKMTNSKESTSLSNENRITMMLIGVVILFLVCQTPTATYLIYYYYVEPETTYGRNVCRVIGNFCVLLVVLNAACNFLLYCAFSKKYRETVKRLLFERKPRQNTLALTSTKSRNSQRFNPNTNGMRRLASEYRTPRNLETQSLTSIPRSKSLMTRPPGKARSTDVLL